MNVAICDDIVEYRLSLKCFVEEYCENKHIKCNLYEFENGNDLIKSNIDFDILFLDIELGDTDGISIAKQMKEKNNNVIILIVTSYHQYLDEAMDINVTRYIDKPATQSRIFSSLDKAMSIIDEKIITLHMNDGKICRLKPSEIIYAEARLKGVFVYTKDDCYKIKETLRQLRDKFSLSYFATPHNSFLVNLNFVQKYKRNELCLAQPYDDVNITISSRRQTEFKRHFLNFIGEDLSDD